MSQVPGERGQPSGVINMSMRKNEEVQIPQADAHLLCIGKKQPRQAGVKEDLLSGSFQEEREPASPQ